MTEKEPEITIETLVRPGPDAEGGKRHRSPMNTNWKRCAATFAYEGDAILCLHEHGHVGAHRAWMHHTEGDCVEWETRPSRAEPEGEVQPGSIRIVRLGAEPN